MEADFMIFKKHLYASAKKSKKMNFIDPKKP